MERSPARTGAESPTQVTHGFCLNDSRWAYGMLEERENPKIIENRPCRFAPGWYAVSLSQSAMTGIFEEMDFRKRFPGYPGPMAYKRGQVLGLVKIGHSLPQAACKGNFWACANYPVANIITEVLPFDKDKPGPPVRGNFGTFPLKQQCERATREAARVALQIGNKRKTKAELQLPPDATAFGGNKAAKAAKATKAPKATKEGAQKRPLPEPAAQVVRQDAAQSAAGPSSGPPPKRPKKAVTQPISPSLRITDFLVGRTPSGEVV